MGQLISPYLDGELSPAETEAIRAHLSVCAVCGQEYATMLKISDTCRSMGDLIIPAPPGFSAAVLQRIHNEKKVANPSQYTNWLNHRWRKTAAAVAASIMLVWGAVSMYPAPLVQIAEKLPAVYAPDNNLPAPNNSVNNDVTAPTTTVAPSAGQNTNPTISSAPATNSTHTAPVFLNKERYIITTLLQVKVADSATALEQALSLADKAQAQSLNLGQQVNENGTYTVLKITVAKAAASELINQLGSLGTVSGQETQKNDITTHYAETLSQYQALVTQRATLQDTSQKAALDQRIDTLAQELQNWEQQAEQETIVLWLVK